MRLPWSAMKEITSPAFEAEVTASPLPVLVDFFTTHCQPCRALAPILEEIAQERPGVKFVKVNALEAPELAARYRVQSVPNLVLVQRGQPVGQRVGTASKRELIEWIDSTVGG